MSRKLWKDILMEYSNATNTIGGMGEGYAHKHQNFFCPKDYDIMIGKFQFHLASYVCIPYLICFTFL